MSKNNLERWLTAVFVALIIFGVLGSVAGMLRVMYVLLGPFWTTLIFMFVLLVCIVRVAIETWEEQGKWRSR